MDAVPTAAEGQTRIVAGLQGGQRRAQSKSEGEEDGEHAPHVSLMVHESCEEAENGVDGALRYHRCIAGRDRI